MASRSKIIREERLIEDCRQANLDIMEKLTNSHKHLLEGLSWISTRLNKSSEEHKNENLGVNKRNWIDNVIKHNDGRSILKYIKKHHNNLGIRLEASKLLDSYGANSSSVRSRRRCVLCYKPRGIRKLGICASCIKLSVRKGTIPAIIQGRK